MSADSAISRPHVCFVVAVPETATAFLNPHVEVLAREYAVDVVADFHEGPTSVTSTAGHVSVAIRRRIEPFRDVLAWTRLFRLFRGERYAIVHSVTPKAGLLAMSAAKLAGIEHRVHWFTGQVWATRTGLTRRILKAADRLTAASATHILVDSESQLRFLISEGVLDPGKASVLGSGSICGVDTERFAPNPELRAETRASLGIGPDELVITFLGRLNRDKGVLDLTSAMCRLHGDHPIRLVLAGSDEESLFPQIKTQLALNGVPYNYLGHVSQPEALLCASDIFCLPSYREGFGLSVIEAAACEVPAVTSDAYGLTDAVVPDETGLMFPSGDIKELTARLVTMISEPNLRLSLGRNARARVINEFQQERLTEALADFYWQMLDLH